MANSGPNGDWLATTPEYWAQIAPFVAFKIWYTGGYTFKGVPAAWVLAPETGVQVVMVYHGGDRRTVVSGKDEYTLPGQVGSKLGEEIEIGECHRIYRLAMSDPWRP